MSNWYVVQVKGGSEAKARDYVGHYVDPGTYRTVFFPQRHIRRYIRGEWKDCIETLFPGYLFVVTNDPKALANELRRVPLFTRLLGGDLRFSCLDDREVALLQAFSIGPANDGPAARRRGGGSVGGNSGSGGSSSSSGQGGGNAGAAGGTGAGGGRGGRGSAGEIPRDPVSEYILGMSKGLKEGNEVIILNGPLMDKTALIRKIDRHKRLAYVELELLGRKVVVKMGLEVVTKREHL